MSGPGAEHVWYLYWNSVMDPDKFREMRKTGWLGHARVGGRTCRVLLTGIRLGSQICLVFMERLVQGSFFDDLQFTNALNASLLIVRSS
jgi:hypothetical protein